MVQKEGRGNGKGKKETEARRGREGGWERRGRKAKKD